MFGTGNTNRNNPQSSQSPLNHQGHPNSQQQQRAQNTNPQVPAQNPNMQRNNPVGTGVTSPGSVTKPNNPTSVPKQQNNFNDLWNEANRQKPAENTRPTYQPPPPPPVQPQQPTQAQTRTEPKPEPKSNRSTTFNQLFGLGKKE